MKKRKRVRKLKRDCKLNGEYKKDLAQAKINGELDDDTISVTCCSMMEIIYCIAVAFCCIVLFAFTVFRYAVMLSSKYHAPLTSLSLDKNREVRNEYMSNTSNYTYQCPNPNPDYVALTRSELEQNFHDPEIYRSDIVVRKVTHDYLDEFSHRWKGKGTFISNLGILSSPLNDIYQSLPKRLEEMARRQWTGLDYHAFVYFITSSRSSYSSVATHWAVDRNASGLYISSIDGTYSTGKFFVIYFGQVPRREPLTYLCTGWIGDCYLNTSDELAGYPIENLTGFLRNELDRPYSLLYDNCQSFSKRLFKEIIGETIWEPLPPWYTLFDGSIEYKIDSAVETLILILCFFIVKTSLQNNQKLIVSTSILTLTYFSWLSSRGYSKIFMDPIGQIPDYLPWIFVNSAFLFRVYHCFQLFNKFKLDKLPLFLHMNMTIIQLLIILY